MEIRGRLIHCPSICICIFGIWIRRPRIYLLVTANGGVEYDAAQDSKGTASGYGGGQTAAGGGDTNGGIQLAQNMTAEEPDAQEDAEQQADADRESMSQGAAEGRAIDQERAAEAAGQDTPESVRGGVYAIIDPETGEVFYVGRTNDLGRREGEHGRDPRFQDYEFRPQYRTNDPATRRGLEQRLYDDLNPSLNRISPISPTNPNRDDYMNRANEFLKAPGS
jgi:hypothetical protein